ncbi:UNVERIFIED_CONTAM: hypothetical protein Scaly_1405200 [Sesamum calycinum]|uniref:Uncharacterized protein n=1 Tax=Sesamum calycinum TaxID=2727403 RepID=A0AAW2PLR1_9LAMI
MWGKEGKINPKDNHISFQCSDMDLIISQLEEMRIEYVKAVERCSAVRSRSIDDGEFGNGHVEPFYLRDDDPDPDHD